MRKIRYAYAAGILYDTTLALIFWLTGRVQASCVKHRYTVRGAVSSVGHITLLEVGFLA
jgi:hypothetical protein